MSAYAMDKLDVALAALILNEPRAGVREYARRLGIARGTAQNRLDKMHEAGIIANFGPVLDAASMGFPLSADMHVTLVQRSLNEVVGELEKIPFILRADSLAGAEDVSCRVAARDHAHLETITSLILSIPGVERIRTDIVLRRRIPFRMQPLLDHLGNNHEQSASNRRGG